MNFYIITLGCKVNAYESEIIKEKFLNNNFIESQNIENAQIVIVNTCSVTNMADNKSKKIIRGVKKQNPEAILVVCGCMSQNHQGVLSDLDIDILLGTNNKSQIVELVEEYINNKHKYSHFDDMQKVRFEDMQVNQFTSLTRAFLKIQDGCNNYCSYCIIPYLRGVARCKDFSKALSEAQELSLKHKEIVLTGIHTGSYKWNNYDLSDLIIKMSQIKTLERIRISSIEILEITNKFLQVLKENPKVCNHLHIPLQSGSDKILKLMNRRYDTKKFKEIVNKIRKVRPDISLSTDLIVGFPGESEQDFIDSYNFCQEIGFSKIHVFPFSLRKNTKAEELPNHIDGTIKKKRTRKMLELSKRLENTYYQKFLNKKVSVLIERYDGTYSYGHSDNYILIKIKGRLTPNKIYQVLITEISQDGVKGSISNCLIVN